MKKNLTEKVVYQPNDKVKITVQNKPTYDEETGTTKYEHKITVNVTRGWQDSKLSFTNATEIEQYMAEVEYDDPQQELDV